MILNYNVPVGQIGFSADKQVFRAADTGLFVTLLFIDRPAAENELYAKLLADKLPANLGYLYENLAAQMLTAAGRELLYPFTEGCGRERGHYVSAVVHDTFSGRRQGRSVGVPGCWLLNRIGICRSLISQHDLTFFLHFMNNCTAQTGLIETGFF